MAGKVERSASATGKPYPVKVKTPAIAPGGRAGLDRQPRRSNVARAPTIGPFTFVGMDLGLLILRLVVGLLLIGQAPKSFLAGLVEPGSRNGSPGSEAVGFLRRSSGGGRAHSARPWVAGLLALGFLSPFGSLGVAASMVVATVTAHWSKGIWNTKGDVEFPLTNLSVAVALALTGPAR